MKLVKTKPKFRCDFCKHTSTKKRMEWHEKMCFRNPDRYCDYCDNRGHTLDTDAEYGEVTTREIPCPHCVKFDKEKLKDIEKYYIKDKPLADDNDLPF